jgi:hypothetical protein
MSCGTDPVGFMSAPHHGGNYDIGIVGSASGPSSRRSRRAAGFVVQTAMLGPLSRRNVCGDAVFFSLREVHDWVPVGKSEVDGWWSAGHFNPRVREWRRSCSTRLPLRQCSP